MLNYNPISRITAIKEFDVAELTRIALPGLAVTAQKSFECNLLYEYGGSSPSDRYKQAIDDILYKNKSDVEIQLDLIEHLGFRKMII